MRNAKCEMKAKEMERHNRQTLTEDIKSRRQHWWQSQRPSSLSAQRYQIIIFFCSATPLVLSLWGEERKLILLNADNSFSFFSSFTIFACCAPLSRQLSNTYCRRPVVKSRHLFHNFDSRGLTAPPPHCASDGSFWKTPQLLVCLFVFFFSCICVFHLKESVLKFPKTTDVFSPKSMYIPMFILNPINIVSKTKKKIRERNKKFKWRKGINREKKSGAIVNTAEHRRHHRPFREHLKVKKTETRKWRKRGGEKKKKAESASWGQRRGENTEGEKKKIPIGTNAS